MGGDVVSDADDRLIDNCARGILGNGFTRAEYAAMVNKLRLALYGGATDGDEQ